ncbi:MAG TPA: choice-of-anchor D domain-containing protein, partial [Saprospiraceae bacterium]|nr:choice-of-anchor D domain-containing protein [Saprospiraceae bacterium]
TINDGNITSSTTDGTDFGNVAVNGNLARTFTIFNTGNAVLTISSITSSNNGVFVVVSDAPTSVAANDSKTFTVTFNPTATGVQNATITINNNDCDESVYDFAVTGTGACTAPSFSNCPGNLSALTTTNSCSNTVSYTVTTTGSPAPTLTYVFTGATTGSGNGDGSGSTFNKGVTNVVITASNGCGSDATCSFTVTVTDNQAPTITCPATQTLALGANCNAALPDYTGLATTGDNCGVQSVMQSPAIGTTVSSAGNMTVTLTVTDINGLTNTCTFTVMVTDNEKPQITCAGPVTINTTPGLCTGTTTLAVPTATDNCSGGIGLSFDGVNDEVTTPVSFAANANATIEAWINPSVTTDNMRIISNTSGTTTGVTLRFEGGKLQFWSVCGTWQNLSNTVIPANQWTHIAVVMNGNQITGFINGVQGLTITCNTLIQNLGMGGSFFNNGLYYNGKMDEVRFWNVARTVTEIASNMSASISAQPGLVGLYHLNQGIAGGMNTGLTTATDDSGNGNNGTLFNFELNNATSNWVDGYIGISYTNNAPATYPKGITTVTWTATDASGNTETCQQTVTVTDNEAPVLTAPSNQSLNVIANTCVANYTIADPIADNCTGSTWTYTLSGATTFGPSPAIADGVGATNVSFSKGVTTVTLNGVDEATNAAVQKTFTVTVNDNEAPTITCPATQTLVLGANCNAALPDYTGLATTGDNCGVQSVTQSPAIGTTVSGAGDMTVTLTVTDINGLMHTCTFTVTKVDNTSPTITCPATQTLVLGANC